MRRPRLGESSLIGGDAASRETTLMFAVLLAVAIGNTGLQSVLPALGRVLKVPDPVIATAYSLSSLVWALASPFWAARLQTLGGKRLVLIGLAGNVVSLGVCALALTGGVLAWTTGAIAFAGFVFGRTIFGLLGPSAPSAAQAIVAAASTREERTKALTMLASAFGLGTILGPAVAPFLVLPFVGLAGPPYVFALLSGAMFLAVWQLLPHGTGGARAVPMADPEIGGTPGDDSVIAGSTPPTDAKVGFTDPRILGWVLVGIVTGHAQAMGGQTMAFLVIDRLGVAPILAQPMIGVVLMAGAGAALLAQWGVIPRLDLRPPQLVLWGSLTAAVGYVGIMFARDLHMMVVAFGISSLGFGLLRPGFTAGASLAVTEQEQGVVAGKVTSINGGCFVLGPPLGVLLYGVWRPLPYLVAAVALLGLAIYGWRRFGTRG